MGLQSSADHTIGEACTALPWPPMACHTTPPPHAAPSPRLGYDLPKHPHGIIVAHVLKVDIVHLWGLWGQGLVVGGGYILSPPSPHGSHLQQHVAWLYAAISSHSPALHDGSNVDAAITPVVALAHDADAQEVVPLCRRGHEQAPKLPRPVPTPHQAPTAHKASPMLRVTVMMFRDMVESVMLLKEEACGGTQ